MIWREYNWPTYYLDFPDSIRCGRGNMDHANATEILTVRAGDEIEIAHQRSDPSTWTDDMFYECDDDRGTCQHRPGYKQVRGMSPGQCKGVGMLSKKRTSITPVL